MDENENDEVGLKLDLGLGLSDYVPKRDSQRKNKRVFFLDLSIPVQPSDHRISDSGSSLKIVEDESIYSKEFSRKKLKLNRDQTTLLEDNFKQHSTLNTAQKQALAEKLNLNPRQVEVWFQNRRARTKLNQTQVDCEFLKKKCEKLTEENRRLKKELFELRSNNPEKPPPPTAAVHQFFHPIPTAAALTSCMKSGIGRGGAGENKAAPAAVMEVVLEAKPNDHKKTA